MTKQRTDSKGDRLTVHRHRTATTFDASNGNSHVDAHPLLTAGAAADALRCIVEHFVEHGAGYLKVRRSDPGADLHLAWTWTLGPHAGEYVYVRVEYWRYLFGLELLRHKMDEVEQGIRRGTPDKMGGGR